MGATEKVTKKLLFVTGTRADFGKLEPLALLARDKGFDVTFWVTGMHMLERYGLTKWRFNAQVLASQNSPTKMELRRKT